MGNVLAPLVPAGLQLSFVLYSLYYHETLFQSHERCDGIFVVCKDEAVYLILAFLCATFSIFGALEKLYGGGSVAPTSQVTAPREKRRSSTGKNSLVVDILKATYGTNGKEKDVTTIVRSWVKDGNYLEIAKQVNFNNVFGDPAPFRRKKLRIVALVSGEPLIDVVRESRDKDFVIDARHVVQSPTPESSRVDVSPHQLVSQISVDFTELSKTPFHNLPVETLLTACLNVGDVVGLFGASFMPVRANITDNVAKIRREIARRRNNGEVLEGQAMAIENLIEYEVGKKKHKVDGSITVSTLWLKRALDFMVFFFNEMAKSDMKSVVAAKAAFAKTLSPWQGWVLQTTCNAAMRMVPARGKVLKILCPSWGEEDGKGAKRLNDAMSHVLKGILKTGLEKVVGEMDAWFIAKALDFSDKA